MSDDENDGTSVVNERLKVRGVQHLRVINSSIIPQIVSANANQISMVICLKGTKLIIQDHEHMNQYCISHFPRCNFWVCCLFLS